MNRRDRLLASLPLLAAALLPAACGKVEHEPDPVRPVVTVTVAPGAPATRDVYSGELRARVETDLGFRIGGKLATRLVDAGARVRKGQALARLDPEDARLAAGAAQAQLASAEADLALAQAELDRAADLLAKKFISASAFDARKAAHAAARARVDQAKAQAALAGNQASYATLASDADGIVVSVAAEPGQVLAAGQPVLRLARDGELDVILNAPEGQVGRFRPGDAVAVFLWADPRTPVPGRIREVAGGADPVTRTFAVRVALLQPPPGARLGMTATVALPAGTEAGLIVLPLTALVREGDGASVWVVDPKTSRVQRRTVTVGQFREDGATILSGLAAGDRVVAAGVHKLRADQPVRLMPGDAAAAGDAVTPGSAGAAPAR